MIDANTARDTAFNKVGKTYNDAIEKTLEFLDRRIAIEANKGLLSYTIDEEWLLTEFKPFNLSGNQITTVLEIIRDKLEHLSYKVIISKWSCSRTRDIEINWK